MMVELKDDDGRLNAVLEGIVVTKGAYPAEIRRIKVILYLLLSKAANLVWEV